MKKKGFFLCAVVLMFIGVVWWFSPRPIIDESYEVRLVRVGEDLRDVTNQVDLEALEDVLRNGTLRRIPRKVNGFRLTDDTVAISGNGSWHIEFGVTCCLAYDSGGRRGYSIQDSGEVWAEVLALMPDAD